MAELAAAQGIARRVVLLTRDATYERIKAELSASSAVLQDGDYLLVTFAGHGAQFDDIPSPVPARRRGGGGRGRGREDVDDGVGDEEDGRDEAWCFYDVCIRPCGTALARLHVRHCRFSNRKRTGHDHLRPLLTR